MAVEIGTLVLKGRFGPARAETAPPQENMHEALEVLRQDLLNAMDERLEQAARRTWER